MNVCLRNGLRLCCPGFVLIAMAITTGLSLADGDPALPPSAVSGATSAASGNSPQTARQAAPAAASVSIATVGFVMKEDAETAFLDKLQTWRLHARAPAPLAIQEELAAAADAQSSVDVPLSIWRAQGGPHPWRFRAQAHLVNASERAWLNVRVEFRWSGQIGDLLADPDLLLTDYDYLAATARWRVIRTETVTLAALAPQEDALATSQPFSVFGFLQDYPNQWPRAMRVQARILRPAGSGGGQSAQIELIPDHFILPESTGRRLVR
ncbi:MAG: hypothetical protein IPK79_03410 [Vampirovibrionales bacterium]|nr:hypothetical protein [Vampirovibrionales bacterium]